jgi:hypothetical protein
MAAGMPRKSKEVVSYQLSVIRKKLLPILGQWR